MRMISLRDKRGAEEGFTLVQLIVALALLVILIIAIAWLFGVFKGGFEFPWAKSEVQTAINSCNNRCLSNAVQDFCNTPITIKLTKVDYSSFKNNVTTGITPDDDKRTVTANCIGFLSNAEALGWKFNSCDTISC